MFDFSDVRYLDPHYETSLISTQLPNVNPLLDLFNRPLLILTVCQIVRKIYLHPKGSHSRQGGIHIK